MKQAKNKLAIHIIHIQNSENSPLETKLDSLRSSFVRSFGNLLCNVHGTSSGPLTFPKPVPRPPRKLAPVFHPRAYASAWVEGLLLLGKHGKAFKLCRPTRPKLRHPIVGTDPLGYPVWWAVGRVVLSSTKSGIAKRSCNGKGCKLQVLPQRNGSDKVDWIEWKWPKIVDD